MQEAHYSMWSPIFLKYIQMVIALFSTKTNLSSFDLVNGKALKNLSDYPLVGVTLLGKLAVLCQFQFLSIFLISLRFQGFNSIVTVPLTCVLLTCDCKILYGLLCLVCEIDCKIFYGLLGLLCEKFDSFSLFPFDKVFIN